MPEQCPLTFTAVARTVLDIVSSSLIRWYRDLGGQQIMPFGFYDPETTSTDTSFDQIIQFGAIRTNDDLEIEDPKNGALNIRCPRLPVVMSSDYLQAAHMAILGLYHV